MTELYKEALDQAFEPMERQAEECFFCHGAISLCELETGCLIDGRWIHTDCIEDYEMELQDEHDFQEAFERQRLINHFYTQDFNALAFAFRRIKSRKTSPICPVCQKPIDKPENKLACNLDDTEWIHRNCASGLMTRFGETPYGIIERRKTEPTSIRIPGRVRTLDWVQRKICRRCGLPIETSERVGHHLSYAQDLKIPLHRSCHSSIHHSKGFSILKPRDSRQIKLMKKPRK